MRRTALMLLAFAIPLIPSPALVPIFFPVLLAILGLLLVIGTGVGISLEAIRTSVRPYSAFLAVAVAVLLGTVATSPDEFGSFLRMLARITSLLFALGFAMKFHKMSDEDISLVARAFVVGVAAVSLLALATSVTRTPFAGEIRPSRGLGLIPSGAKSAGVIRSYGEAAVVYSGGLALLYRERLRFGWATSFVLFGAIVFGVSVAQSRNVLASAFVTLLLIGCHWVLFDRSTRLLRRILKIATFVALLTPLFVGIVVGTSLGESSIAEYFIGEGTFERSVGARVNHVRVGFELVLGDPLILVRGTTLEQFKIAVQDDVAPHNQFISLLLFITPLLAVFTIGVLYIRPSLRGARFFGRDDLTVTIWMVGSIYALSNYEGLFSPSLSLCLGLNAARLKRASSLQTPQVEPRTSTPAFG